MIRIKKGFDLPLSGAPEQEISDAINVKKVALIGDDYHGMKPSMLVKEGDQVKLGQPLFKCKKFESVMYTSPAAGKILAINRGDRRVLQSIVIQVSSKEDAVKFDKFEQAYLSNLDRDIVRKQMLESGLWTALRTRPFSHVPMPTAVPRSIFITAMDSAPHAPDIQKILDLHLGDFINGVVLISKLTDGKVHACHSLKDDLKLTPQNLAKTGANLELDRIITHQFSGPHPAGNVGTHIHYLDPVDQDKSVWHIGLQDVIAVGKLFTTGQVMTERIISLSGPRAKNPRLLRTRLGANISELLENEVLSDSQNKDKVRIISGSVLYGRTASGAFDYLGRFHQQISLLAEGEHRELLGWLSPGTDKLSVARTYISSFLDCLSSRKYNLDTNLRGSKRAMVPIGLYEKIFPFKYSLPTQLLRSLLTGDTDQAQRLGVLELDEEDLALCTFVDPGKVDYGPILRNTLNTIEKEG